ncbi:MAG: hypothetical protein ACOYLU_03905 [Limisphaerales bacterium]|jgi:hypothetical protein
MIALRDDFLLVAQDGGHYIPCSVEHLTFELAGSAAKQVDPVWMKEAAAGVLHYFKDELGKSHVTVAEFTTALTKVFQGLGLTAEVSTIETPAPDPEGVAAPPFAVWRGDLQVIAAESGNLGELAFQQALLTQLAAALESCPQAVEFSGLRGCVKMITGRKHWCPECRKWSAWIVDLMRSWMSEKAAHRHVSLVVH